MMNSNASAHTGNRFFLTLALAGFVFGLTTVF